MVEFKLDLCETVGEIKPMNAVNNGPVGGNVRSDSSNFEDYKSLNIPYARNHDASHCNGYGGEHTVDVHRIFKNFDADVNATESYWFEPTDDYIKATHAAGTQTFYRLGAAIEHWYKYGTRVPKDFTKWAQICEHIIRHYGTSPIAATTTALTLAGREPTSSSLNSTQRLQNISNQNSRTSRLAVLRSVRLGRHRSVMPFLI